MLKITYYHTLYKREVVDLTDRVVFKTDGIYYHSLGFKNFVEYEYIRKIEEDI